MTRTITLLVGLSAAFASYGQTPPQKPNTTPIPATPPLVLPGPPDSTEASSHPISADEAALIALRLQPSITVAQAQAQAAHAQVTEALAGMLPSLSVGSSYDWVRQFSTSGTGSTATNSNGWSNSVSAHQLLFDFFKTVDQVKQARATAKAADYSLTAAQANLVYSVKQQFYSVVQNLQLVDVYTAEVKSTQDQLDLTVAQLSAGLGVPSDVVTAAAGVANATNSLVQARSNYLISRVTFAALIGVDPRTPIVLSPSTEPANNALDFNAMVDSGLRNRPEILQAEQTLRAAGFGVSVASKELLPTIQASVSSSAGGPLNPFGNSVGVLGISLNWPIFDGGLSSGQLAEARAGALSAQASLVAATQNVVSDVSSAYVSLQAAEQNVSVAASAVANAQEGLRLSQGRFKAGVTTFVEVTQAQATLVTAQSTQAQAEASLETARAQMSRAIGSSLKFPHPDVLKPIQPSTGAK